MKKLFLFLLVCVFLFPVMSWGQLLTESFSGMTVGSSLSAQGSWSTNASATNIVVSTGSLSYTGYPSSSGDKINITTASGLVSLQKSLSSSINSGTVYFSFLLSPTSMTSSSSLGDYIFSGYGNSDRPRVLIKKADVSNILIGISKDGTGTTQWSGNVSLANTHLIVVKYTFNTVTTSDDQVDLFVDSSPISSEPVAASATISSGNDGSSIAKIQVRQITLAGVNVDLDEIRVATTWSQAPLPVELTSFTGAASENGAVLNWATATEVNNYGFNVERYKVQGTRDEVWEKIGFVQGHGNSNSPKSYSFTDANAPAGNVSYRLKQIDFDGKYEYSDVVNLKVAAPVSFSVKQNYPNPFNPVTVISYQLPASSQVILRVYDVLGKEVITLVNENQSAGKHQVNFDGKDLPSGMYIYKVQAGSYSQVRKMLLVK